MIYRSFLILLILLSACKDSKLTGTEFEKQVLEQAGLRKDTSMNEVLIKALEGVNCLSSTVGKRKMILAGIFDPSDSNSILIIPFSSGLTEFRSSAYSDIKNHFVLLNPSYIAAFAEKNTLNDTTNMTGLISLMLLHELGHFITGFDGSFDAIREDSTVVKQTGEIKMDTEPEYLTTIKKREMEVDSIAMSLVKRSVNSMNRDCFSVTADIQILLPGMSFSMFGIRLIDQFGQRVKILRDPSSSHPNMELRIAFMNYFLYPSDQLKEIIDQYLYDREVTPVQLQLTDPHIYQGQEKILPEDKK